MKKIVAALMAVMFLGTTSLIRAEEPAVPTVSAAPVNKTVPPKSKRKAKKKRRMRKARAAATATPVVLSIETPAAQ
jgi:hypothetical protein